MNLVLPEGAEGGLSSVLHTLLARQLCTKLLGADTKTPCFVITKGHFFSGASGHILLCGAHGSLPKHCPQHTVGVLQSDYTLAARELGRLGVPAVSCGMAVTDTLTLSSITPESAAICLQRSIPLLGGGEVEPGEVPLTRGLRCGGYTLMCAVAALLLTGGWELLAQAEF